jgi:hypothetical protein
MYVMSPEDRSVTWRTASSRRGEEREALRHLLVSEMLVELGSDLDLTATTAMALWTASTCSTGTTDSSTTRC